MATKKHWKQALQRSSSTHIHIQHPHSFPLQLFARKDVPIERGGVEQILEFASLQETLKQLKHAEESGFIEPYWGAGEGRFEKIVLTPDFHKSGSIPVGTVAATKDFILPAAVGNDICCGMRLLITDLRADDLIEHIPHLKHIARGIYFEGKRELPLSPRQRRAMLCEGLQGLLETCDEHLDTGLWTYYDPTQQKEDLEKVHMRGSLQTSAVWDFADYIEAAGGQKSYDSQIGSIGGGNHFVEFQIVEECFDTYTSRQWGLSPNQVVIMIHSGSVGLGHHVGRAFRDIAKQIYPAGQPQPAHGFYPLPLTGPHKHRAHQYLNAMSNAANFGFANRMFLGLMAIKSLSESLGRRVEHELLYDAPHNLIWTPKDNQELFIHRKGACPAYGPDGLHPHFGYTGYPVLVPGSMGTSSYILSGLGQDEALCSACHGAGRSIPRGKTRRVDEKVYEDATRALNIVTPIDPDAPQIRHRRDILQKYHERIKEEAPYAYKDISPVIRTIEEAQIARKIAKTRPCMTIKG
ncbi:MAG: RNA-splicing ligase RtcB [Deltaproteobacteria bacterium]|nr:RNA-splicing ligase RtcB [Deltaproteobacteria bacterium]MBU51675.1 RNA-splicing ligase RtcB [Deltaproteobacteria bacterium]|tara:strand:+ start:5633 stop:7195 length:1563 start_codon:yes stop_codon:yes gene_type:complete